MLVTAEKRSELRLALRQVAVINGLSLPTIILLVDRAREMQRTQDLGPTIFNDRVQLKGPAAVILNQIAQQVQGGYEETRWRVGNERDIDEIEGMLKAAEELIATLHG